MIIQKMDTSLQVQSGPTVSKTRSGRISKPPERYTPIERVEDDYDPEDYDSDVSDVSSTLETDSDEEDVSDSDVDEDGNLEGFVVSDKNETYDEITDGESSVPPKKRTTPPARRPRGGNVARTSSTNRTSRIS